MMSKYLWMLVVGIAWNASCSLAAEDHGGGDAATGQKLPVAVVAVGEVEDALVERARKWAEDNLAIPVPRLPDQSSARLSSFDHVASFAAGLLDEDRLGLVMLWKPAEEVSSHGIHSPDKRVSVINLGALLTPDTDEEVLARRIERQVIRGIGQVMGLEPSPNPFSAMFSYRTMEELDAIGRNLDPPWLLRLQEAALKSGIPLDPGNSYNLVSPSPGLE